MSKLFNDTLFDNIITFNNHDYKAHDVALYSIMMDDLMISCDSDFIRSINQELIVMLSQLPKHSYLVVQYEKEKINSEFERVLLRRKNAQKKFISMKLNETLEFERTYTPPVPTNTPYTFDHEPKPHDLPAYAEEEDLF